MPDSSSKVSIVLPTYNGASYLRQSIESCLCQTHKNLELIIIDDGSTDATPAIVRSFQDDRIRYVCQPENQGHVKALNRGFAMANGDFLTWTSDDNYYCTEAIETMANALLKDTSIDFVYANYDVIDTQGAVIRRGRVEPPEGLDADNYVGGCFLYRRRVYETIGDFSEEAFLAEDYEYWLRVREKFTMKKLEAVLYCYRSHDKSLTAEHTEEKVQSQVERIRERYISPWKRHYYRGRKFFYANQKPDAQRELLRSFRMNPFYYETWRLLILLILNPVAVHKIREWKSSLKK